MSTDRQQDAGMDRLLRAALEPAEPVSDELCPEAGVVAAYTEGGLTARERIELEPHLAACARCQSVLAVMALDAEADADSQPARVPAWRAWFSVPRLRWLVPASAAAIAIVLYVAVKPEPTGLGGQAQPTPAAAPAPEFTVARRLDQVAPTAREEEGAPRSKAAPALPLDAEKPAPRPADTFSAARENEGGQEPSNKVEPSGHQRRSTPYPLAPVNVPARAMPESLQPPVATGIQARTELAAAPAMVAPPPAPTPVTAAADTRAAAQPPAARLTAGLAPAQSTLVGSTLAEAVPPPSVPGAANRSATAVDETRAKRDSAAGAGRLTPASPAQERQKSAAATGAAREADSARSRDAWQPKGVVTVEAPSVVPAGGLEGLWNAADFVVHARAIATRAAFLEKVRVGQDMVTNGPHLPTDFSVLEVFKRHNEIPPTERFVVTQTGGEAADETTSYRAADWVTLQAGAEYVLFLERVSPTDHPDRVRAVGQDVGIYRLDGDRVVIGKGVSREPVPSRADLLARLRQFAGTTRRD